MVPLFGYSSPQVILLILASTFLPSQIIFNAYRTIFLGPEIDMLRPRRNRLCTLTRNSNRSQNTRLGTRFIWKQKTYDYGSSEKAEALSFTLIMSDHLNFLV